MANLLAPTPKAKFFDNNGRPAVGYKIFTYAAGTTTKVNTFRNNGAGVNTNPIILDFRGEADIWIPPNFAYKFVFSPPNDTDPPTAPIWTVDNIDDSQLLTLWGGVDTGSANAYVLDFDSNFTSYNDGLVIYWLPSSTNTGASTINVNGLGPVSILNLDGSPLSPGQITVNQVAVIVYRAPGFRLLPTGIYYPRTATEVSIGALAPITSYPSYDAIGYSYPERFGAAGDDSTDDTAACQAAIDAAPVGGIVVFSRSYRITSALQIRKAITIRGCGYDQPFNNTKSYVRQTTTTASVFRLIPSQAAYAFGAYGIVGVRFENICLRGGSNASRCLAALDADTSINGGDIHIRHIHCRDVSFEYCTRGVDFQGIAYLNEFSECLFTECTTGFRIARGAASDNGGQTRFFGCCFVFCNTGFDGTGTVAGDFSFFGCTVSDGNIGININEETVLLVSGCSFENNQGIANSSDIYCEISDPVNPNTETAKTIIGSKFLNTSARNIYWNKTSAAFPSDWQFPTWIDGNTFLSVLQFNVAANVGTIVIGPTNGGTGPAGSLADAQLINFADSDLRRYPYNRLKQYTQSTLYTHYGTGAAVCIGSVTVPNGQTAYVVDLDRYSVDVATGARGNAEFRMTDAGGTNRILSIGSAQVDSTTWLNSTGSTQVLRIFVSDNGTGNPYYAAAYIRVQ